MYIIMTLNISVTLRVFDTVFTEQHATFPTDSDRALISLPCDIQLHVKKLIIYS
jgi:hypothetical protein